MTVIQWVSDFSERIKQLQNISLAAASGGAKELKVVATPEELGEGPQGGSPGRVGSWPGCWLSGLVGPALSWGCFFPQNIHVCLGGLFVPEAYITATRQYVAQANSWSLEELCLEVNVTTSQSTTLDACSFGVTGEWGPLRPAFSSLSGSPPLSPGLRLSHRPLAGRLLVVPTRTR